MRNTRILDNIGSQKLRCFGIECSNSRFDIKNMFLVTKECSLAYFGQNLVAYFTNQGVETPCYRISKATAFSCEHPIASYCFCKPRIAVFNGIVFFLKMNYSSLLYSCKWSSKKIDKTVLFQTKYHFC